MKLSNKDKKKLVGKKDLDQIYTVELILSKLKSALLVGVTELIDENLYKVIKDNLTSTSHAGKIELGGLEDDLGVTIRMAFNSVDALNQGINTILLVAQGVIDSGVKEDRVLNPRPRPELKNSLNHINALISDDFPMVPNLPNNYQRAYQAKINDPIFLRIINNARLVPNGYKAEIK